MTKKQPIIMFIVLALLLCRGNSALSFTALTDDEMTRVSGHAGINLVADSLKLRMEADSATLKLNPDRPNNHYLKIADGSDGDTVAMTIGSGTADASAAHSWQPATISTHMSLNVGDDGARTALNLAVYDWDGDLFLKADQLELNRTGHTNLLFGLNVGAINFADDGANPSMYMKIASHDTAGAVGISGEMGMKLLIDEIGFTGINSDTARGVGLLFCEDFNDNASATHLTADWTTDYWLANSASGMWTMGNLDYKPLTLDVATYNNNNYIIMTVQGGFTKRHTYPDMGSSNMGSNTVWVYDGTVYNANPNDAAYDTQNTWNSDLGEVRLDYVEARTTNTGGGTSIKNIGGLSLEDLAMERTYIVMTPDGDPYSGHIYSTNALNPGGNETELPGSYTDYFYDTDGDGVVPVTWNSTF